MLDKEYLPQLAAEYQSIDIEQFATDLIDWAQEPGTDLHTYAVLDTVLDMFLDNLIKEY